LQEGFDGAGVSASQPQQGNSLKRSTVSAGGLPNQLVDLASGAPRTLEENFQIDLEGLRDSGVEHLEVLQDRRAKFRGRPSLLTAVRWTDTGGAVTWVEKTFWLISDGVVYSVRLKCPRGDLQHMQHIYDEMVETFALHCPPAPDLSGSDATAPACAERHLRGGDPR
jgi:hypothetical protein